MSIDGYPTSYIQYGNKPYIIDAPNTPALSVAATAWGGVRRRNPLWVHSDIVYRILHIYIYICIERERERERERESFWGQINALSRQQRFVCLP